MKPCKGREAKGSSEAFAIDLPVIDNQDIIILSCFSEGAFCILSACFFKPLYYNQGCFSGTSVNVQEKMLMQDHSFQNAVFSV